MATLPQQRPALAELPLAPFIAPSNGLPSPVSLPTKRGPPTPQSNSALNTPKRRILDQVSVSLGADELGTGKSPARRLFMDSHIESSACASTPPPGTTGATRLAPSPPLKSSPVGPRVVETRSRSRATRSSTKSSSASHITGSNGIRTSDSIHYIGFTILSDDDAMARSRRLVPPKTTNYECDNDENEPPKPTPSRTPSDTPTALRRARNTERSRLGLESVSASSATPGSSCGSDPSSPSKTPATVRRSDVAP